MVFDKFKILWKKDSFIYFISFLLIISIFIFRNPYIFAFGFILMGLKYFSNLLKDIRDGKFEPLMVFLIIIYLISVFGAIISAFKGNEWLMVLFISSWFLSVIIGSAYNLLNPWSFRKFIMNYVFFILFLFLSMSALYAFSESKDWGYLRFGNCDNDSNFQNKTDKSNNYIYYSAVTLFSLGYGDICPMGMWFRFMSGFETFLGHFATVIVIAYGLQNFFKRKEEERWSAINKYVYNFIYLRIYPLLTELFNIFEIKYKKTKEKPITRSFGVDYMNPVYMQELYKDIEEQLKIISKKVDRQNVLDKLKEFSQDKYKKLHETLEQFHNDLDDLLIRYPHQIPPEILSNIIDVREISYGLKNSTKVLGQASNKVFNVIKDASTFQSKQFLDLFNKLGDIKDSLEPNQDVLVFEKEKKSWKKWCFWLKK